MLAVRLWSAVRAARDRGDDAASAAGLLAHECGVDRHSKVLGCVIIGFGVRRWAGANLQAWAGGAALRRLRLQRHQHHPWQRLGERPAVL